MGETNDAYDWAAGQAASAEPDRWAGGGEGVDPSLPVAGAATRHACRADRPSPSPADAACPSLLLPLDEAAAAACRPFADRRNRRPAVRNPAAWAAAARETDHRDDADACDCRAAAEAAATRAADGTPAGRAAAAAGPCPCRAAAPAVAAGPASPYPCRAAAGWDHRR